MNETGIVIHINRRIKIPCREVGHVGRYETLICEEYCVIVSPKIYLKCPWM
jgi:hypothetical protein